jgi:hypothetical protein
VFCFAEVKHIVTEIFGSKITKLKSGKEIKFPMTEVSTNFIKINSHSTFLRKIWIFYKRNVKCVSRGERKKKFHLFYFSRNRFENCVVLKGIFHVTVISP